MWKANEQIVLGLQNNIVHITRQCVAFPGLVKPVEGVCSDRITAILPIANKLLFRCKREGGTNIQDINIHGFDGI